MGRVLEIVKRKHITTARMDRLIDEWIFSKRNRLILKRKLLDEETYEKIAEEFGMSIEQTKRIVKKGVETLKCHL